MKVSLKLDSTSTVLKDLNLDQRGKVHLFATNEATKRMDKYVPFDRGTLKSDTTIKAGETTYNQPYAQKQYYENKGKGLRGNYWDKKMVSAESDMLAKDVQKYMEGL